jgi:hypothetical protein
MAGRSLEVRARQLTDWLFSNLHNVGFANKRGDRIKGAGRPGAAGLHVHHKTSLELTWAA